MQWMVGCLHNLFLTEALAPTKLKDAVKVVTRLAMYFFYKQVAFVSDPSLHWNKIQSHIFRFYSPFLYGWRRADKLNQ